MFYRKEPKYQHGTPFKTAAVLVNLGTPDAPTTRAVRRYLKQFLSDPRVVELPKALWWFILHAVILPFRSRKSAEKYASIWTQQGSPLKVNTEKQATLLRGYLGERGHDIQVAYAMRYGSPSIPDVLTKLKGEGVDRVLIVPAYPQYSGTTTASIMDEVARHYGRERNVPELRFVKHYHDAEGYILALAKSIQTYWGLNGHPDKLVMSFHGVPKQTLMRGDPYHCECHKTARLLATELGLSPEQYCVTFQSRFGRAAWLQPYMAPTLEAMGREGVRRVDVICPGFTSDCLETLEEVAIEGKQHFLQAGGKEFHYIPCLNVSHDWIVGLTEVVEQHVIGWSTILTPSMQDEQKKLWERSRLRARELGAEV